MKILGSIRSKLLAMSLACVVLPLAAPSAKDRDDLELLVAGVTRLRALLEEADLGKHRAPERFPGPEVASDEALTDYAPIFATEDRMLIVGNGQLFNQF